LKQRLFRTRRLGVALIAGVTALGAAATIGGGVAAAAAPTSVTATAASAPAILPTGTNQTAGNLTITLNGAVTTGDTITLTVLPNGGTCSATSNIAITGPGANSSVTENGSTDTNATNPAPSGSSCGGKSNGLTVTLTGTSTSTTTVVISGITYTTSAAASGPVVLSGLYTSGSTTIPFTVPSNATVTPVSVTSIGSPALAPAATNQPIGNVVLQEPIAGAVPTGYVCLTLSPSNSWANTATNLPTVTVSPGSGAIVTPPVVATAGYIGFDVTTASGAAASYTISGLLVSTSPTATGAATLTVSDGQTATCSNAITAANTLGTDVPFSVTTATQAIYGPTADATTAMEFETAFKGCTESNGNVVLATDAQPYDALAAAYLESQLGTGILITSPTSLSQDTINAIRVMGVKNVYVVGGPLAVSPADLAALAALPVYTCGGGSLAGGNVNVIQAATTGATADATAQLIDNYITAGSGILSVNGAYSAATATTGGGLYNDTTGNSSAVGPVVPGKTAIVVSDTDFRDAMAASGLAYAYKLPVILTTPTALSSIASSELTSLGITQVIALGGPLALSNAVVTSIQGMNIPVLRIAGQDYTDTAAQIAKFEGAPAPAGLGWKASEVLVAQGQGFSDALGAAAMSGLNQEPILLTLGPTLGVGQYTIKALETAGSPVTNGFGSGVTGSIQVLGGPLAVTASQITQMQGAL
jgi:putative cell wall-binding protein